MVRHQADSLESKLANTSLERGSLPSSGQNCRKWRTLHSSHNRSHLHCGICRRP